MANYDAFKGRWLGRRVDYDHVYAFQCVDLILQYLYEEFGIASGVWGNAIDYWYHPQNVLLAKFDKLATTDCHKGDIVIFYGLSGNPYGHIGICESQDGSNVTILEQNGAGGATGTGRDAIELRAIPKSRIAGVLRPKGGAVPTPTPGTGRVFLPGSVRSWRLYRVGSGLRPNTSDQIATLAPSQYGGLTYPIDAWVGDYAVVITTQMFGKGVIWVKGTEAQIK
jgi:hypothetical protein